MTPAGSAACALGFRVKSGWATVVLLAGPARTPRVVDRGRVELSDSARPETRQPCHADFGVAEPDSAVVQHRVRIIGRCARKSVGALIRSYQAKHVRLRGAVLVVGSVVDPATIANPHIRAHATEGRLFRTVLEDALGEVGVCSSVLLESKVPEIGVGALGLSPARLRQAISELGRELGPPWGAAEKVAAMAAWTLLAGGDDARD